MKVNGTSFPNNYKVEKSEYLQKASKPLSLVQSKAESDKAFENKKKELEIKLQKEKDEKAKLQKV